MASTDKIHQIARFVHGKILSLQKNPNDSAVRASLAKMRRGIGEKPGDQAELWEMLFEGIPEELEGCGEEPSTSEWAVYTALTLFSLHQQGKDIHQDFMFQENINLGMGIGRLARKIPDSKTAVIRRFNTMATSMDLVELSWHLRGIIQLLKRESIPLDYGNLAKDLYLYQSLQNAPKVRLNWGRNFYRELNREKQEAAQVQAENHPPA